MDYATFFERATGRTPFPYQRILAEGEWPELIDVPTGLGKTAAVGLAWLYRRSIGDERTPRRLVWCLPMRSLVEQTHSEFQTWVRGCADQFQTPPSVNMLMGGEQGLEWAEEPERDAVIIGTQDMLVSRTLMRGYGMSRYAWPMHYAWLHNDALWVFDETQLMGVSVPTSAQLQGLRQSLGTAAPTHSIWMSATLSDEPIDTVDHRTPEQGWRVHALGELDRAQESVTKRTEAKKRPGQAPMTVTRDTMKSGDGLAELARAIFTAHRDDSLTLVVLNRVMRAQALYEELEKVAGDTPVGLLHSRFRPVDRQENARLLTAEGGRIIVATQVVEAGVDVSARTLFTELAPWPSLVQRFGRCNRYGEFDDAEVFWIDLQPRDEKDGDVLLPYTFEELETARTIIKNLDDVGPNAVRTIAWDAPSPVWPILRRRDLLELFDTTPDLSGNDLDVSRYIRDGDDTDVSFYWRDFQETPPVDDFPPPAAEELCRVSIGQARTFVGKKNCQAWRFDPLDKRWRRVAKDAPPRPGEVLLVASDLGGYEPRLGFTGPPTKKKFEPVPPILASNESANETMGDDPRSFVDTWVTLAEHTRHVTDEVTALAQALDLDDIWRRWLVRAARWHDVGKAHTVFQKLLLTPPGEDEASPADPDTLWAKSDHRRGKASRRHFRHELASALAFLQTQPSSRETNATAYLIAAHHGKVRLSIRSLPGEDRPPGDELFARGVWHGDVLPSVDIGDGHTPEITLDLSPMRLGPGSWLERSLDLRDAPELGPFRLAFLESILRLADHRASAREQKEAL
ncbi:MAG: CRISPR-associated endonuclease Cas3'' [Bradymonadaceae bacterium]